MFDRHAWKNGECSINSGDSQRTKPAYSSYSCQTFLLQSYKGTWTSAKAGINWSTLEDWVAWLVSMCIFARTACYKHGPCSLFHYSCTWANTMCMKSKPSCMHSVSGITNLSQTHYRPLVHSSVPGSMECCSTTKMATANINKHATYLLHYKSKATRYSNMTDKSHNL